MCGALAQSSIHSGLPGCVSESIAKAMCKRKDDRFPSVLDFINAETEYRTVELSYVNLVGSYLTAAAQLNLAVGREVIQ